MLLYASALGRLRRRRLRVPSGAQPDCLAIAARPPFPLTHRYLPGIPKQAMSLVSGCAAPPPNRAPGVPVGPAKNLETQTLHNFTTAAIHRPQLLGLARMTQLNPAKRPKARLQSGSLRRIGLLAVVCAFAQSGADNRRCRWITKLGGSALSCAVGHSQRGAGATAPGEHRPGHTWRYCAMSEDALIAAESLPYLGLFVALAVICAVLYVRNASVTAVQTSRESGGATLTIRTRLGAGGASARAAWRRGSPAGPVSARLACICVP